MLLLLLLLHACSFTPPRLAVPVLLLLLLLHASSSTPPLLYSHDAVVAIATSHDAVVAIATRYQRFAQADKLTGCYNVRCIWIGCDVTDAPP
jgi:hypothetical protein